MQARLRAGIAAILDQTPDPEAAAKALLARALGAGSDDNVDREGGYGVVVGSRNGARYPNYHRMDLSFRRTFEKGWGVMTPYLNLVNAYNQRNVLFYFYEYNIAPPTRSGISMFPVLPTIGLEISF